MSEESKATKKNLTPSDVLNGASPLVLTATLKPIADQDRFQPAGFPEVGHVIYKAPRGNGFLEQVCIVDSAASMANHLESVCMRGSHDYELVDELAGMPYLRCVTDLDSRDPVVTSLTEGHRIASTYFLGSRKNRKWDGKGGQRVLADGGIMNKSFGDELIGEFAVELSKGSRAHPPAARWWKVFDTIGKYDPNALVHGVLFPEWQIRIPRALTAHMEAFGAARVDRSGVKFDHLQITSSKQPIFAVDDATAREIRATFILDVALVRSFGRQNGETTLGLTEQRKEFLIALALWKIDRLLATPFRFRSGCHLQRVSLKNGESDVEIDVNIQRAIVDAAFRKAGGDSPPVTDIFWPHNELYSEVKEDDKEAVADVENGDASDKDEDE